MTTLNRPTGGVFVLSINHDGIDAKSDDIPHDADEATVNAARLHTIQRWETKAGRALPERHQAHAPLVVR